MKWTDTLPIVLELIDNYPNVDPQYVRFTDLHKWVCAIPSFEEDPNQSNEKILEAIQMTWIQEKD